ncbi:MAG: DUF4156 domain-containing protein [Bacteriovoracaceae bacterium]|nr:DUF4156 domain-containing protein [Bacteriovoracaceae bacterium]
MRLLWKNAVKNTCQRCSLLSLWIVISCANLTESGSKVTFIESNEGAFEMQEIADKLIAKEECKYLGFIDADTALFPGSYSVHENEIHSALRNRAAKVGANLVIANFYQKPAQGIVLLCPEEFLSQH